MFEQQRLYFRGINGKLYEWCSSSNIDNGDGWYRGDLSKKDWDLDLSAGIDAVVDEKTKQLKVFCLKKGEKKVSIWYTDLSKSSWESRKVIA